MLLESLLFFRPISNAFLILLFLLWGLTVSAIPMVYNASIPETLSAACSDALLSDVACDPVVKGFRPGFYYPPETLERVCTTACKSGLDSYWDAAQSACGNETLPGEFDLQVSALSVPGTFQFLYSSICLQDGGRYCNNIAAIASFMEDPGISMFNYLNSLPSDTDLPDPCDPCFIKTLQLRAGSPYFDGPMLANESTYESMTSSCGVSGQPLTTTTLGFYSEEPTVTSSPCTGTTYAIQPGDDCHSISLSEGIGTAWLLSDNNLASYCDSFPTSGDLCLVNTCDVYTVQKNDTCNSIAHGSEITVAQLKTWNPIINAGCYNLERLNGTQLCVSAPGKPFVPPDPSDIGGVTPTTAAPVPSDASDGSNTYCGKWYEVQKGDYCNLIILKFGISVDDFIFLNPSLNKNCTNLYRNESYCVQPVGDINTYPGKPGHVTATGSSSPAPIETPFSDRPKATATPYERLYTPLPLANGTRDDCALYFDGADYQYNLTDTPWNSNCEVAIEVYGVDPGSFVVWNDGLSNVSLPSCSFQPGVRYCGSWYMQKDETSSIISSTPASTSVTPTESVSVTPTGPSPTSPTQTGQPSNCNKWHTVEDGDDCQTVADEYSLTKEQFLEWNPVVSDDCREGFWLKTAYCVGVDDGASTAKATIPEKRGS